MDFSSWPFWANPPPQTACNCLIIRLTFHLSLVATTIAIFGFIRVNRIRNLISSDEALRLLCGWKEKRVSLYIMRLVGGEDAPPSGLVSVSDATPHQLTLQQGDKKYSFVLSGAKFNGVIGEKLPQLKRTFSSDPLEIFLADKSHLTLFETPD